MLRRSPTLFVLFVLSWEKKKKTISMGGPMSLIAQSLGMFHERDISV